MCVVFKPPDLGWFTTATQGNKPRAQDIFEKPRINHFPKTSRLKPASHTVSVHQEFGNSLAGSLWLRICLGAAVEMLVRASEDLAGVLGDQLPRRSPRKAGKWVHAGGERPAFFATWSSQTECSRDTVIDFCQREWANREQCGSCNALYAQVREDTRHHFLKVLLITQAIPVHCERGRDASMNTRRWGLLKSLMDAG